MLNRLGMGPTYSVYDDPVLKGLNLDGLVGHRDLPSGRMERLQSLPQPVFIKTHDLPGTDDYPAVYIVRDGRDALTSFAHYLTQIQREPDSLSAVLTDLVRGQYKQFPLWSDHVQKWKVSERRLELVKYEDLIRDPQGVVLRTLGQLRAGPPHTCAPQPPPSFDELRRENPLFFRKGIVGDWATAFPPTVEQQFWKWNRRGMQIAGYDLP